MQIKGRYLTPAVDFVDTKANIEAFPNPEIGMRAYASDNPSAPLGSYNGTTWQWMADDGSGGGGGTNSIQIDCSGGTSDTYGVLSGSINGSNKVFTASLGSYISGGLQVYLNGQLMTQGTSEDWTETTPASGTFTMTNAPVAGDVLLIVYKHSTSVSGNADTVDGYEAETLLNNPRIGRNTVEVDFETGDLYKVATVNDALCTSTSIIVATVLAKATDNSTADDIMVQPFEVQIKNQTTGFFDIVVKSLIGKAIHEVPVSYILMN